jgi:site-specific recombinase XerD
VSKGRSLQKQVVDALKTVTRLRQSRHQAKRRGTADRFIYSNETLKTYTGCLITAVKWIKANRAPDLKELREITHADWLAYITDAEADGQSGGGLRSTIAALHKLESGLRERQWWTDEGTYIPAVKLSTPRSGARGEFSEAEVQAILQRLDGDALLAAQLTYTTALRLNEV